MCLLRHSAAACASIRASFPGPDDTQRRAPDTSGPDSEWPSRGATAMYRSWLAAVWSRRRGGGSPVLLRRVRARPGCRYGRLIPLPGTFDGPGADDVRMASFIHASSCPPTVYTRIGRSEAALCIARRRIFAACHARLLV